MGRRLYGVPPRAAPSERAERAELLDGVVLRRSAGSRIDGLVGVEHDRCALAVRVAEIELPLGDRATGLVDAQIVRRRDRGLADAAIAGQPEVAGLVDQIVVAVDLDVEAVAVDAVVHP